MANWAVMVKMEGLVNLVAKAMMAMPLQLAELVELVELRVWPEPEELAVRVAPQKQTSIGQTYDHPSCLVHSQKTMR